MLQLIQMLRLQVMRNWHCSIILWLINYGFDKTLCEDCFFHTEMISA